MYNFATKLSRQIDYRISVEPTFEQMLIPYDRAWYSVYLQHLAPNMAIIIVCNFDFRSAQVIETLRKTITTKTDMTTHCIFAQFVVQTMTNVIDRCLARLPDLYLLDVVYGQPTQILVHDKTRGYLPLDCKNEKIDHITFQNLHALNKKLYIHALHEKGAASYAMFYMITINKEAGKYELNEGTRIPSTYTFFTTDTASHMIYSHPHRNMVSVFEMERPSSSLKMISAHFRNLDSKAEANKENIPPESVLSF